MHNYFAYETAARRYDKGRPYFHPFVMEKIAQRLPGGRVESSPGRGVRDRTVGGGAKRSRGVRNRDGYLY